MSLIDRKALRGGNEHNLVGLKKKRNERSVWRCRLMNNTEVDGSGEELHTIWLGHRSFCLGDTFA